MEKLVLKKKLPTFNETVLVRIDPEHSTLPVDTAAEMLKGISLVNELIGELARERYVEEFEDENGNTQKRTRLNPMIISLLREKRMLMDQAWKISGGEAVNEAKKEMSKSFARHLFETNMDEKTKNQYRERVYEILEEEENGKER